MCLCVCAQGNRNRGWGVGAIGAVVPQYFDHEVYTVHIAVFEYGMQKVWYYMHIMTYFEEAKTTFSEFHFCL